MALGNKEFLYIDIEESILCLDKVRQYYCMIEEAQLYHCTTMMTRSYVCTKCHAVICSDWQEKGVVKLL